jgi:hypothetical protein
MQQLIAAFLSSRLAIMAAAIIATKGIVLNKFIIIAIIHTLQTSIHRKSFIAIRSALTFCVEAEATETKG